VQSTTHHQRRELRKPQTSFGSNCKYLKRIVQECMPACIMADIKISFYLLLQNVHKQLGNNLTQKEDMSLYPPHNIHQKQFDDCMLEMFSEGLPFNFVERKSFQKLIRCLNPRIRIKSRTAYRKKLSQTVQEMVLVILSNSCC